MAKKIPVFVTGNQYKMIEAEAAFRSYGLDFEIESLDIDEIQHHEPLKITEAKARAAYEILNRPVIVHDSNWSIPALNGFPGGYMKDVDSWFEPGDFIDLMKDKADKSINLLDTIAYFDGKKLKIFVEKIQAEFIDEPRGGGQD
ncbi:hypothetical protein CR969_02905 [Candidatus Saccharibacteria bacterium]|nr:MAG: hypothetical protein CR969_02905 [Candidatus Saccharibacteria bacterium]